MNKRAAKRLRKLAFNEMQALNMGPGIMARNPDGSMSWRGGTALYRQLKRAYTRNPESKRILLQAYRRLQAQKSAAQSDRANTFGPLLPNALRG